MIQFIEPLIIINTDIVKSFISVNLYLIPAIIGVLICSILYYKGGKMQKPFVGIAYLVLLVSAVALVFVLQGCTVKLIQLSPDEQMKRDLGIYQQAVEENYQRGYEQGIYDYEAIQQYMHQFMDQNGLERYK